MSKGQHGNKESKKPAALSLKEKRSARKSKKQAKAALQQPIIPQK